VSFERRVLMLLIIRGIEERSMMMEEVLPSRARSRNCGRGVGPNATSIDFVGLRIGP
jgi:hypothetical protein